MTEVAAATDVKAAVRGDGEIRGVVTDPAGQGVEGVVVRGRRRVLERLVSPAKVDAGSSPDTVEEAMRAAAREFVGDRTSRYRTETDADGRFVLDDLPPGELTLQASKPGYLVERPGLRSGAASVGSRVHFVARQVVSLPVRVVLPGGEPAQEAVVLCSEADSPSSSVGKQYAWSRAADALRLPAGRYTLTAFSGSFATSSSIAESAAELRSSPLTVALSAGLEPEPAVLHLEARAGIRGRIILAEDGVRGGTPEVKLQWLRDARSESEVDLEELGAADQGLRCWRTTEFAFSDLDPGWYAVGVNRGGSGPIVAHRIVEVVSGFVECELEMPPIRPTDYIVVRAFDSQGTPVDGLRFSFEHRLGNGNGQSSSGLQAMRGVDGTYYFGVPSRSCAAYYDENPDGDSFRIEARHPRLGARTADLVPGQTDVEILFEEPAQLEVQIVGANVDDADRVVVTLQASKDVGLRFGELVDDNPLRPDGVKRFEALVPGVYEVRLALKRSGGRVLSVQSAVARRTIELKGGPNSVQLAIPPLHDLEVVVPGAEESERIDLLQFSDPIDGKGGAFEIFQPANWRGVWEGDGRFRFTELPAGTYVLMRSYPEPGQMQVTVPCDEVVFRPDEE